MGLEKRSRVLIFYALKINKNLTKKLAVVAQMFNFQEGFIQLKFITIKYN